VPAFSPDGRRIGDPRALLLDWSGFPPEYLRGPGAVAALNRALDSLTGQDRAALLVDTEGLALRDVARGLDEPVVRVRRRLHRARMIVREELTAYFAAATTPH
jgi:DNA-directed RNA polymerase specialized sigma24 family protein